MFTFFSTNTYFEKYLHYIFVLFSFYSAKRKSETFESELINIHAFLCSDLEDLVFSTKMFSYVVKTPFSRKVFLLIEFVKLQILLTTKG